VTNSVSAAALLMAAGFGLTADLTLARSRFAHQAKSPLRSDFHLCRHRRLTPLLSPSQKAVFDRRLSFNDTMACGMCHIEEQAFTSNQLETSVGMEGKSLRRNAPSLFKRRL